MDGAASALTEPLDDVLRRSGMRATLPRRAILDIIRTSDRHWSVENIRHELTERRIDVPRSSVNNVLGTLADAGLVSRIDTLPGATRFESEMATHDHFWCTTCRSASNVPRAEIEAVPLPGHMADFAVTYVGHCDACGQ